jgi:hypothetical protein
MVMRTLPAGVDMDMTSVGVVDMADTTQLELKVLRVGATEGMSVTIDRGADSKEIEL